MAIQIQDLDPTVQLYSIKKGFTAGPFADSLAITPPNMIAKFWERVIGYINMEEIRGMKKAEAWWCYNESLRKKQKWARTDIYHRVHMAELEPKLSMSMKDLTPWEEHEAQPELNDELKSIQISQSLDKVTFIR